MSFLSIKDVDLTNKKVLIRADLNVPIKDGVITSTARIDAFLPTLKLALSQNAKVLICSHLGRPQEGEYDQKLSLDPVAAYLSKSLGFSVPLAFGYLNGLDFLPGVKVMVLENVRFNVGEKSNSKELAQKYANLADVFVMDAFGTAHRAEASTCGVIELAQTSCAGLLLSAELEALNQALKSPKKPLVAIVGGSKVSSKLKVLENLAAKCSSIIVGGGIANTFLAAAGFNVGNSLYEKDLVAAAQKIAQKVKILIPQDVVTAKECSASVKAQTKELAQIIDDDMILDVGAKTCAQISNELSEAGTILWNGPVGVFELAPFANGTKVLSEAIAASKAFSIAGGGDTLAAIKQFQVTEQISYISTGGGAFLEFVEGKTLPAIAALEAAFAKSKKSI